MDAGLRKEINANFVIRFYELRTDLIEHASEYENPYQRPALIGAGQLHKRIGTNWANKLAETALESQVTIYTKKLRRGVKVEFHSK